MPLPPRPRVHDLVIVGAGPAGAASALTAKRVAPTADVAVVDRAAFPRDKTCGDAISPDAVAELGRIGVPTAVEGFPAVSLLRLRSPAGLEVRDAPPTAGYVVPRLVFDDRLATAARATGVRWVQATVRGVEGRPGSAVVRTTAGALHARVVIGADGANSVVRRGVTGGTSGRRHRGVAVRGYAPAPPGDPELALLWERADGLAYAWSFPIDAERSNVGYGQFGAAHPPPRTHLEARLRALVPHATDADGVRGHVLPLSSGGARLGDDRVLLAGDAASLINPITGEGIYYALLSGRLAAQAALREPSTPLATYRTLLRTALGAHLRTTSVLARLASAGPVLDHLVRAAAASATTADLLADLAFGKGALTTMTASTIATGLWRAGRPARQTTAARERP